MFTATIEFNGHSSISYRNGVLATFRTKDISENIT